MSIEYVCLYFVYAGFIVRFVYDAYHGLEVFEAGQGHTGVHMLVEGNIAKFCSIGEIKSKNYCSCAVGVSFEVPS